MSNATTVHATQASAQLLFESASPPMKAAMLWRDAMRVIGGSKPLHTKGPQSHGWDWEHFPCIYRNTASDDWDKLQELTQAWVDLGMEDPTSRALLLDGISWRFYSDADLCDAEGFWCAGEGVLVAVWPSDAPDEFGGFLGNPVYSTDLDNSTEGIFHAGVAASSGREAFIHAWEEMGALGCHFDMAMQRKFNQQGEYDDTNPIDKKIKGIIPELVAAEEACKISEAAGSQPSATPVRPRNAL